jgi:hypothetical protein
MQFDLVICHFKLSSIPQADGLFECVHNACRNSIIPQSDDNTLLGWKKAVFLVTKPSILLIDIKNKADALNLQRLASEQGHADAQISLALHLCKFAEYSASDYSSPNNEAFMLLALFFSLNKHMMLAPTPQAAIHFLCSLTVPTPPTLLVVAVSCPSWCIVQ